MNFPAKPVGNSHILDRNITETPSLTERQAQADQLVDGFLHQAMDFKSLAAMTVGGWAYRLGRIGVMGVGSGSVLRTLSMGVGLTTEVAAFEGAHRALQTLGSHLGSTPPENPNLWRWSGSRGLQEGLLFSFITFGTLKIGGRLTQGQNLILQHGIQDFAMVAGHQFVYRAGIEPRPEGSFADQMLHAEATNLQLMAGMGLAHGFTGGRLLGIEQGMDVSLRATDVGAEFPRPGSTGEGTSPLQIVPKAAFAMATAEGMGKNLFRDRLYSLLNPVNVWMKGEEREERKTSVPPVGKVALYEDLNRFQGVYDRIHLRLESVFSEIEERSAARYLKDLDELRARRRFWEDQVGHLGEEPEGERKYFERDIQIGLKLLSDRLLRLGAEVFQEPADPSRRLQWGLTSRFQEDDASPHLQEGEHPSLLPSPEGIFPALVNQDVGFGRTLSLRPHQGAALNAIRGRLALREAQLKDLKTGETLPAEYLSGTIVMPVGGGKTRTMMGGFAAAIEKGLFQAKRGDKLIILNHTDQIHEQNLKVTALLEPYFKRCFGRALQVSEYKAGEHDVSGDVVVVSIPSVNTEERRERFSQELQQALGEQGQIAMVAVDEVHHVEMGRGKGKETWLELLSSLRKIDPHFYQIGFTATPTGRETRIFKVSERELMWTGVTPRTYLVNVEGENLSQLKVAAGTGDFVTGELVSTLLKYPERNTRTYASLEEHGLRKEKLSPSNKAQLEATLGFAADLSHARMMAEDYQKYFGKENGSPLHGRKLILLGGNKGKITKKELEDALQSYRRGEIDGIVTIVSGVTKGQKDPILEAVKRGEIEAVFTVDALVEGADLYMFTHLLGSRSTFSPTKKGQEKGRVNRRDPDEVSPQGQLLKDTPRILFDVIDRYDSFERSLVRYGEVMGIPGHTSLKTNRLFDALSGEVVEKVNRSGQGVNRPKVTKLINENKPRPRPKAPQDSSWTNLIHLLQTVLAEKYHDNLESLALDLGEGEELVLRLLKGEGWENNRRFLKRLATLLYEERGKFFTVYNEERGTRDETVTPSDYAMLREAMALVEEWEGPMGEKGLEVRGHWDWGKEEIALSPKSLGRLYDKTLGDLSFRSLWRALFLYFKTKAENGGEELVRQKARKKYEELIHHFFMREAWPDTADSKQGELLLLARQGIAQRFAGPLPTRETGIENVTPQGENTPLNRWLKGEKIEYSKSCTPHFFYGQIRALLKGHGVPDTEIEEKIKDAIFEERGWGQEAKTAQDELLLKARKGVARHFGGALLKDSGIPGVASQGEGSFLTRWLRGEQIKYGKGSSPQVSYDQIRALLKGFGVSKKEIEAKIEAAIFEERGWERKAETKREELLLLARQRVARHFGGTLPQNIKMEGIPSQLERSPLTRWLKGEKMEYGPGFSVQDFYEQIRILLKGLGAPEKEIEKKIEAAIFEERGWGLDAKTSQEELLLLARRRVARIFGGVLPTHTGIEGIAMQRDGAPLTRWIDGEKKDLDKNLLSQIRALLVHEGFNPEEEADRLIENVKRSF
jgi:superfamily II DNA or RNA helicase